MILLNNVDDVVEQLNNNKIVVLPTETCYIFAANIFNESLIYRIFELKKRDKVPIGILIKDFRMMKNIAFVEPWHIKLLEYFWPGPLSIVLKKTNIVPNILTAGFDTVSMRISPHEVIKNIFEFIDFPLTATSANIHGMPTIYSVDDFYDQFAKSNLKDIFIYNYGDLKKESPSTIVDLTCTPPKLLREGPINFELFMQKYSLLNIS